MNEFTKEELQMIGAWGELYKSGADLCWPKLCSKKNYNNLINKIQSMIDNYCEHEHGYSEYSCIDCGVSEYRCNKCAYVSYEGLE